MTEYVVYEVKSTMEKKSYRRAQAAAQFCIKLNSNERIIWKDDERLEKYGAKYTYTTREDYESNVVHMVQRKNLMSGELYWEKSNTPACCSPARETYWSM